MAENPIQSQSEKLLFAYVCVGNKLRSLFFVIVIEVEAASMPIATIPRRPVAKEFEIVSSVEKFLLRFGFAVK